MHQRNFPSVHVSVEYALIVFNGLGEYACRGNLTKTFDLDDERKKTLQKSKTKKQEKLPVLWVVVVFPLFPSRKVFGK